MPSMFSIMRVFHLPSHTCVSSSSFLVPEGPEVSGYRRHIFFDDGKINVSLSSWTFLHKFWKYVSPYVTLSVQLRRYVL